MSTGRIESTASGSAQCPYSTLEEMLRLRADDGSDAPAVLGVDRPPMDFAGLLDQCRLVADSLSAWGLGRGDRVASVMPDGPEAATLFVALASCVTAAPLNPAYRAEDFDFYLQDLGARAVVVPRGDAPAARAVATARGLAIIELSGDAQAAGRFGLSCQASGAGRSVEPTRPEDIALLLHTSGTTSRPKIVPLSHANLCASVSQMVASLSLTPGDRCLNLMPLFHVHGLIGGLLASIAAGASVACPPGFRAASFFDWLGLFRPTWYTAVPTMHQAILAAAGREESVRRCPLRFIRSASASLPPPVMEQLERLFVAPVLEAYGMTEGSHQIAVNPLPPRDRKPGSVGLAAGPEVTILDDQGRSMPAGQTGEIALRGPSITRGYEANPQANQAAFTHGWFRTGDQGYIDERGYIYITGRLKEIINRGGEKIVPREIDEALLAHPEVTQATAFALPHVSLGEDVAAAVVLRSGASADEAQLRAFAFERLPAFKVPSRIVILDQIPKGPTGKVQRIGLAAKLEDRLRTDYEAPMGETEELVARLFAEVLRQPRVGRHDNFFALGGDSIRATQVLSRLSEATGASVHATTLFQHPSPAQFAAQLGSVGDRQEIESLARALAELSPEERERLLRESGGVD